MKLLPILLLVLIPFNSHAQVEPKEGVLLRMLKVIRYSDIGRAAFHARCAVPKYDPRPSVAALCKHLDSIPDSVIESAAMPYVKIYMNQELAQKAIEFWSSKSAQSLKDQLILEVRLGKNLPLTSEQSALFHLEEQSDHGIALRKFADDRAQGRAVAQAMVAYATAKDAEKSADAHHRAN